MPSGNIDSEGNASTGESKSQQGYSGKAYTRNWSTQVKDNMEICVTAHDEEASLSPKIKKKQSKASRHDRDGGRDQQALRLKINSRERTRMHDLNKAVESLREVMPYANSASVRKLSKIATLLLAKNYILTLTKSLEEMQRLLAECSGNQRAPTWADTGRWLPGSNMTSFPSVGPDLFHGTFHESRSLPSSLVPLDRFPPNDDQHSSRSANVTAPQLVLGHSGQLYGLGRPNAPYVSERHIGSGAIPAMNS